ncbi:MAG TPA: hypothetical protein VLL97_01700, partial [Acidobacteriota bacterium]|nr:hypothetical protein [Acidobacteriota bacterium]
SVSIFIEAGDGIGPNPDNTGTDFQDLSSHLHQSWYYFTWRASTDPQIAKYRIYRSSGMAGFAGAQLIGVVLPSSAWTTTVVDKNGNESSIWGHGFTTQYNPLYPCYYFVAEYVDGTLSTKIKTIVIEILPSVARLNVSVAEPNLSFNWEPVPGAIKYLIYYEYGNIGKYALSASPFIVPIPPRDMKIRITAHSADGRWSLPTEEEVNIAGIYNWNEIVALNLPSFANGTYVNMSWINGNTVQRPSLAGGALAAPYAGNVNDSDLFNFVFKYDDVVANNFDAVPATWFRSAWWQEQSAYFESPVYDMGAVYTGRFHLTLNRTITIKQLTDAEILPVPVENYEHYSPDALERTTVGITANTQISEDGVAWKPVENGAWVTMRYMRTRISIAEASPLADIRITTGQAFLDVPDLTESKNDVLAGGQFAKIVTFTKGFRAVNIVLCNAVGNATAWPTNITATGFIINCSVAGSSVYWFAKGY